MPELPEVETVKRSLEQKIAGAVIHKVTVVQRSLRVPVSENIETDLLHARFEKFDRRGKYILCRLSDQKTLLIHLGMSGMLHAGDTTPSASGKSSAFCSGKHVHLIFDLNKGRQLLYSDPRRFGRITLHSASELDRLAELSTIGPEPLEDSFTPQILERSLEKRTSAIKTALMDQRVVAGIGNIYACESLYYARINPATPAGKIKGKTARTLHQAIRDVLNKAIEAGGSTLRDYKRLDGSAGYFQNAFAVYNKEGQICKNCQRMALPLKAAPVGKSNRPANDESAKKETSPMADTGRIVKIKQGGRSTYYCPGCQAHLL